MTWTEFIAKIKHTKKTYGRTGLNPAGLARLLWSGAFDSMLPPEAFQEPAHDRYRRLTKEMYDAMGSKAKLPAKAKKELLGVAEIVSAPRLMLWRHDVNPLVQFDITQFYKPFLESLGFEKLTPPREDILWERKSTEHKGGHTVPIDLRYSWFNVFDNPSLFQMYTKNQRLLAMMVIVLKSDKRIYQEHKESLSLVFFNGHETTDEIKLWPNAEGKLNKHMEMSLKQCELGLAIIQPKLWKGNRTGTLINFMRVIGI
jgi:hypothetical protein